eukprot:4894726-Amphidinium_carterae.1
MAPFVLHVCVSHPNDDSDEGAVRAMARSTCTWSMNKPPQADEGPGCTREIAFATLFALRS